MFKDTLMAFFIILNNFEFLAQKKGYVYSFYMHIRFLQNLQRFDNYLR